MEEFKLTTRDIDELRILITHPAWERVMKPNLELMRQGWNLLLLSPAARRESEYPDNYIRGCISTLDSILSFPEVHIREHDQHFHMEEQTKQEADAYLRRAKLGRIGPFSDPDSMPTIED